MGCVTALYALPAEEVSQQLIHMFSPSPNLRVTTTATMKPWGCRRISCCGPRVTRTEIGGKFCFCLINPKTHNHNNPPVHTDVRRSDPPNLTNTTKLFRLHPRVGIPTHVGFFDYLLSGSVTCLVITPASFLLPNRHQREGLPPRR